MRKIVIAYITPCNYCPFKVKTGRLRDTVPARTCAPGKYQIYCPGGAFDVSPHQAITNTYYIDRYYIYIICVPTRNRNNEFILEFILREIKMADFERGQFQIGLEFVG